MNSVKTPWYPVIEIRDGKSTHIKKHTASKCSEESDICRFENLHRHHMSSYCRTRDNHRSPSLKRWRRWNVLFDLEDLIPVYDRYGTNLGYRSYRPIHDHDGHDNDDALETYRVRQNVAYRMRDLALFQKNPISIIKYWTKFKRAGSCPRLLEWT